MSIPESNELNEKEKSINLGSSILQSSQANPAMSSMVDKKIQQPPTVQNISKINKAASSKETEIETEEIISSNIRDRKEIKDSLNKKIFDDVSYHISSITNEAKEKEKLLEPSIESQQRKEELDTTKKQRNEMDIVFLTDESCPQMDKKSKFISSIDMKDKPEYQVRLKEAYSKLIIDINETSQSWLKRWAQISSIIYWNSLSITKRCFQSLLKMKNN